MAVLRPFRFVNLLLVALTLCLTLCQVMEILGKLRLSRFDNIRDDWLEERGWLPPD